MRFITFIQNCRERVGVSIDGTVFACPVGVTLLDLLKKGRDALSQAGNSALKNPVGVFEESALHVIAPIPNPPTVRDFMTFEQHVSGAIKLADPGSGVPQRWYEAPIFYFTNPYAIHGPYDDVMIPQDETQFDFELEIAAVVGRRGRDIPVDEAERYIAGYTIMNDWSARAIQFQEMSVRLGPSKGKDSATTLGPWFVTPEELEPFRAGGAFDLRMEAYVNDERIGSDSWAHMSFTYAQMVSYASRGTEVRPGDIIGSGTCGDGCLAELWGNQGYDAHRPLLPGDIVTLSVEGLGTQRSRIIENSGYIRDFEQYRSSSTLRKKLGPI
ncbi:fumarylacetoacetate hydrolase family protein [Nocardia sp. NPDC004168]|uniref:fumarylacetoacetate hydrolase family protein n=1 Tax=Nocardia sp. NPDC004168 TaxID=3154452 RepID=UPI0033B955F0